MAKREVLSRDKLTHILRLQEKQIASQQTTSMLIVTMLIILLAMNSFLIFRVTGNTESTPQVSTAPSATDRSELRFRDLHEPNSKQYNEAHKIASDSQEASKKEIASSQEKEEKLEEEKIPRRTEIRLQLKQSIGGEGSSVFHTPGLVAFNAKNNRLYVTDSRAKKIIVINAEDFTVITTIESFLKDGERQKFRNPHGIAVNNKFIAISDASENEIYLINSNGTQRVESGGSDDGQIRGPQGVCIDEDNNLYVTDHFNHRIQVFSSNGTYLYMFGKHGYQNGQLDGPMGITYKSGKLYIADQYNNRIQIFSKKGIFISAVGSEGVLQGEFINPYDAVADSKNRLFVSDTKNHRIEIFDAFGAFLSSSTMSENITLRFPRGIAVHGNRLFVVDANRLQEFTTVEHDVVA